jgi:hypothetical protein
MVNCRIETPLAPANAPATVDPAPKAEDATAEAEKPVTPSMPDPLVAPLEEPPVPTDLVTEGAEPTPTESVVVNLINRLVERGVLTQGDASELVSQAQRDAAVASQNAAAAALVAADATGGAAHPSVLSGCCRQEVRWDSLGHHCRRPPGQRNPGHQY